MRRPHTAGLIVLALSILFGVSLVFSSDPGLATEVQVRARHQAQLAYTLMNADKGSLFVGDVYLLDALTGQSTQLMRGGSTTADRWLWGAESLLVSERTRGSEINAFGLQLNTGELIRIDARLQGSLKEPIESGADVRSPDGRWLLSGVLDSKSPAAIVYHVLQISPDGVERLQTIRGESFPAPVWLPDSSGLLYWSEMGSLCLLNIAAGSRDCREAVYGSLSNVVVDPLIAYVTEVEGGYQLCIAPIVDQSFGDTSCPVTHTDPILFPLWRP